MSAYFLNIDGNASNFDNFLVECKKYKHSFSVIGLAETNTSDGYIYQIPGYYSLYQDTIGNKPTGTGVALYIQDAYNASINRELSQVTKNIETLFVTIKHKNGSVINIGVVYRPPNGDTKSATKELELILENCPKKSVHILGDYNIDLHDQNCTATNKFEEITTSTGFYPTISVYTHQKSEKFKKSCIDNIFTNEIETILQSGTISNKISHHFPSFQVMDIKSQKNNKEIHVQHYDYRESRMSPPKNFTEFDCTMDELIDKNCKLEKPKNSKRNIMNNPWITPGLMAASNKKHKLHDDWKKTCSKKNPEGNTMMHITFLNYRRTLTYTIKRAKLTFYGRKFLERAGNRKIHGSS